MTGPARYRPQDRSGVLVLTLLVLVLISVIVLGLLASVTAERQSTESNYQQRRALSLAMLGFQTGVAQLRDALGTGTNSWDNPYGNFCNTNGTPNFFWSVSPGILTHWSYTQTNPVTNYPLFSYTTDINNTALVNLNRPLADGSAPIIGGANPPDLSVQFVNILQDPSQAAGPDNKIVGRYAFWIDDENAKININVADGSRQKYSADWMKNSLGLGSPTEESLQVLSQQGAAITSDEASNIVYTARNLGFHSPREILRVSGTTPDLYTNNVFDLTDDSKSPDVNIFGQPKMAILPVMGGAPENWPYMSVNAITLKPVSEIYPTIYQLPTMPIAPLDSGNGPVKYVNWPIVFHAQGGDAATGRMDDLTHDSFDRGVEQNDPYNNAALIAYYLAGMNGASNAITWPAFPGASSAGFNGKYTPRQMDEIGIQIASLGSKLIDSDIPFPIPEDYPTDPSLLPGNFNSENPNDYYIDGNRFDVDPFVWIGPLSRRFVVGMGRTPKVTQLAMTVQPYPAVTSPPPATNIPPYALITFYLEEWIPGAYRGGDFAGWDSPYHFGYSFGGSFGEGCLNSADQEQFYNGGPSPAPLPGTNADGTSGPTNVFWANQMLTNNQGIDFSCNSDGAVDPDQADAALYHPWAATNSSGQYMGASSSPTSIFHMNSIISPNDPQEWGCNTTYEGALRLVSSTQGSVPLFMKPDAGTSANPTLYIGGGLSVTDTFFTGSYAPGDPTPLEVVRGFDFTVAIPAPYTPPGGNLYNIFGNCMAVDANGWSVPTWSLSHSMTGPAGTPGGTGSDLRARHVASVIPVNFSMTVPTPNHDPPYAVETAYYSVADPLVNKFPGDWVQTIVPGGYIADPSAVGGPSYDYYSDANLLNSMSTNGGDPDSYWVPQGDVARMVNTNGLLAQTLIPRSARMPNVGYLQYVRTGIVPDDETVDYYPLPGDTPSQYQHGTPFRLLSFGPCNNPSDTNQVVHGVNYPDWAMLDLLYVPSILNSYGGPYANYTNLASFGTYGGATAGRINPNGCVVYTTNTTSPAPNILRTLPLQSTFYGLHVNQTFAGTVDHPELWGYADTNAATFTTTIMDAATAGTLASNIAEYISTNGPLRIAAEICNIPAVTNYYAPENILHTRNDLVRQMIGQLTTQSNTFSVWTVGQVIQKAASNRNYGEFEPGDQIMGEVRLHLILERYLDPGADGVYGNSTSYGYDNQFGSLDDPADPTNHPYEPKFLYRVVRSEEVR